MPKLNVQQNNQNVIQAFKNALAIGNLKGIIASDGSHNFSTAGSNRNLLDNPWWGTNESVNQRGVTSGNGGYFVDRWHFSLPGTASVTWSTDENGFTGTTTTNFIITHKIHNVTKLGGKTLTASVMLSDGTIHSGTIVRNNATSQEFFRNSNPTWVVLMDSDNSFRIRVFDGTLSIRAVKLELGSVSTLANDAPPDYGEELAKCQRYFVRFAPTAYTALWGGISANTGLAIFNVITPVPMRAAPTVSVTNAFYFVEQLSSGPALRLGTAYTAYAPVGNIVRLGVNTNSTLTTNNICQAYTYAYTPIIDLSADL